MATQDSNGQRLMNSEAADQGFREAVAVLRRHGHVVIACFIIVAGAAFGLSRLQTKEYTATAALLFSNSQLAQEVAGLAASSGSNATQQSLQDTNVQLVEIGDMAAKAASRLGRGLTKAQVKRDIAVAAQSDTNIVDVSATTPSPALSSAIANTYSGIFVSEQETANHQYYVSALATLNAQLAALSPSARSGSQGLALQERAESLATLADLPTGAVQIAAPATLPTAPSSPRTTRNTLLGALLGLLLGLGVVFLRERLDQRIREPHDLEALYGLPLLGIVPESNAFGLSERRASGSHSLPTRELEAFHLIRAHLRYFRIDRRLTTLLIASAGAGEGKTTVARSLGAAAAQMGSNVLLIEADLRRPTVARRLNLNAGPGLVDVLIGATTVRSAIQVVDVETGSASSMRKRPLAVLVAGATVPPNPGELLESQAMVRLLTEAADAYDLIIIDTAPLTAVSDTFTLLRKVDGVIVVGRLGIARRDAAQRLRATLEAGGSPLLGVIANAVKTGRRSGYGYAYYDYEAAYDPMSPDAEAGAEAYAPLYRDGS